GGSIMFARVAGMALLAVGGLAWPAQGQTVLQWKFKEGETFSYEIQEDLKLTYELLGTKNTSEASAKVIRRFTILESHSEGTTVIRLREELGKLTASGGLAAGFQDYRKLLDGATYTLTLSPRQGIAKLEGYEALLRKLAAKDPEKAQLLRQGGKGEENLKRDL